MSNKFHISPDDLLWIRRAVKVDVERSNKAVTHFKYLSNVTFERDRGTYGFAASSLTLVHTLIQFVSQVLPPSSENACSERPEFAVKSCWPPRGWELGFKVSDFV